jgi:DNA polymerase III delta prime subunit
MLSNDTKQTLKEKRMRKIHLILQKNGGVGKSLVASLLTQYLIGKNNNTSVICTAIGPFNCAISGYKSFDVNVIDIFNDDLSTNQRELDALMEKIISSEKTFVIENGTAAFFQWASYVSDNKVLSTLAEFDKEVIIHFIVVGGQKLIETLSALKSTIELHPAKIVVWKNTFFGDIIVDGNSIEKFPFIQQHKITDKILGFVKLDKLNPDSFAKDFEILLNNNMTFEEAMTSDKFTMMARRRLKIIQRKIFDQIESTGL